MIKATESEQEIFDSEQLRLKVINAKSINANETYYYNELKKKKALGLAYYEENKIVAGCILTGYENNLYIDWIFTDKKYRNKGKATELLNYIEKNKGLIEIFFSLEETHIKLEPKNDVVDFYEKRGFKSLGKSHYMTKVV